LVRVLASQSAANRARVMDPLRLSYTIFADKNPWMKGVQKLAVSVAADRKPVTVNNPFLAIQTRVSNQILSGLDGYRAIRDQFSEQAFFGFYGSPLVQACLGVGPDSVRPSPGRSPAKPVPRTADPSA
jgi:hypothetical protein